MRANLLTREQAVALVGEVSVKKVEGENCEPTNLVGYQGACAGDALCEHSASVKATQKDDDGDDETVTLTAYYYTTNEQDEVIAETGDGSNIDWEIAGYDIN